MNVESKIISREISPLLWRAGETVCTAESCTSGQISAAITSVPGSSTYFKGGIVCYTNEIKTRVLGVPEDLLAEKGPVSEEVVRAMFDGALKSMETTYAIAITGYAGPGGGSEAPVGTIWIAVAYKNEISFFKQEGDEGRTENVRKAIKKAPAGRYVRTVGTQKRQRREKGEEPALSCMKTPPGWRG